MEDKPETKAEAPGPSPASAQSFFQFSTALFTSLRSSHISIYSKLPKLPLLLGISTRQVHRIAYYLKSIYQSQPTPPPNYYSVAIMSNLLESLAACSYDENLSDRKQLIIRPNLSTMKPYSDCFECHRGKQSPYILILPPHDTLRFYSHSVLRHTNHRSIRAPS